MFEKPEKKERSNTRLEVVGRNSANYPILERVVSKKDVLSPKEIEQKDQTKMGRRHFLGLFSGALSATALTGIAGISLLKKEDLSDEQTIALAPNEEAIRKLIEGNEAIEDAEQIRSHSNSHYFFAEVDHYAQRYEKDLPTVLAFANKTTIGDPQQRNRMEYVSEALHIDDVPDVIVAELQKYIVGLCDVESSFNASKVSPDGAFGALQFMPATWKEHGDQAANELSLMAQVEAAQSKFKQIYEHITHTCSDELLSIQVECFGANEEKFQKDFLTPVIINAFNAGQGTMEKMIKWFARNYGTEGKLVGAYAENEALSGYDVFFSLAHKGYEENADHRYQDDAYVYVQKVFGATKVLLDQNKDV